MTQSKYQKATSQTAASLRTIAGSLSTRGLSHLSLPEVDAVIELTSKVIPAGNVPGMILSGLARLPGKKPPLQKMHQDITSLFKGVEHIATRLYTARFLPDRRLSFGAIRTCSNWPGRIPMRLFQKASGNFMPITPCAKTPHAMRTRPTDLIHFFNSTGLS